MAKFYGLDSSLIHDAKPNEGFVIDMVRASDYLELERQRDALVAENVAMKDEILNITFMDDEVFFNCDQRAQEVMGRIVNFKTPATDSALREIGANAVDKCAESLLANDDISVDYEYSAIRAFAQQLREGKV